MMLRLLLAMVLGMVLFGNFGCGAGMWQYKHGESPGHIVNARVIPIYIDSKFSNNEIVQLNAAMREWNEVFNGQVILKIERKFVDGTDAMMVARRVQGDRNGWMIAKLDSSDERLENVVEFGDGKLAFVPHLGGQLMVILGDRLSTHNMKTIVMHEMGHMLGAEHVFGKNLMHPAYGPVQIDCIDKVTALQVAFYNDLDFKTLSYCRTPEFE